MYPLYGFVLLYLCATLRNRHFDESPPRSVTFKLLAWPRCTGFPALAGVGVRPCFRCLVAKPDLWSSVKFKRLCRDLNLPRPYVVGLLETLWQSGYSSANPFIGNSEDVECAAEWPGNPGILTNFLQSAGFLDQDDAGYYIHNLLKHAPEYVKKRILRRNNKDLCSLSAENGEHRKTMADNGGRAGKNGALTNTPILPTEPNPPIQGGPLARFVSPTLDEVIEEGSRMMMDRDKCEEFFYYYESNGWKVGKNAMKKWRAALNKWKRTSFGETSKNGTKKINPFTGKEIP